MIIGHFYVFFDEISFLSFLFLLFGMFVLFHTVHGVLKAGILKWFAISFFSGPKLWKILKEMGIPDHLTCLLRNLYAGQDATVRTGHETTDWFQIGKGVHQGCILSPCLFNLYAS